MHRRLQIVTIKFFLLKSQRGVRGGEKKEKDE
jgi:hypothetical protein